jgi:CheY-like chemotaxis protein
MSDRTRVLIVDDDVNLSKLLCLMLEKTRMYEVLVENRSADAVAKARALRPELILLDVDMPGKSGGQVARELQADPVLKNTKIIFITALLSKNQESMQSSVRTGMRYLSKPVDPMTLLDTIEDVLSHVAAPVSPAA